MEKGDDFIRSLLLSPILFLYIDPRACLVNHTGHIDLLLPSMVFRASSDRRCVQEKVIEGTPKKVIEDAPKK